MTTTATSTPKLAAVKGVEIFCAGVHRDKHYTTDDLDRMCENFERLNAMLKPPVVVGHSEDQTLLEDSGIPAAGRVERIWRDGDVLKADFAEVPETIARLINGRAYNHVSAEVYNEPPPGCEGLGASGRTLRRVALLGGELPQIKRLQDLPLADYSERPGRTARLVFKSKLVRPVAGTVAYFSEVRPMAKRNKLAKFSEKCKATWKKFADEAAPPDAAAPAPAGVTRDDMIAMLVEAGYDPAVLDKAADELLAEMIRVSKAGLAPMAAEPQPGTVNAEPPVTPPVQTPAPAPAPASSGIPGVPNTTPSQVTLKFGEKDVDLNKIVNDAVASALKPLNDKLAAAEGNVEKFAEAEKKKSIDARLDLLLKQGKVLPAEVAGLKDQLYRANGVQKFSDGKTELDKQFDLLEARPQLVKFAETVKGKGKAGAGEEESQKVERFAEENESSLKAAGKTKAGYVAGFVEAKKKRPELTAQEYGVPAGYGQ